VPNRASRAAPVRTTPPPPVQYPRGGRASVHGTARPVTTGGETTRPVTTTRPISTTGPITTTGPVETAGGASTGVRTTTTTGVTRSPFSKVRRPSGWHRPYAAIMVLLDYLCAASGSLIAIVQWPQADAGFDPERPTQLYLVGFIALPLAWVFILWSNGAYDRRFLGLGTDEFKRVIRASITVVAIVAVLALGLKADLSRLAVATALAASLALILVVRVTGRILLYLIRRRGKAVQRLLLVGTLRDTLEVATVVNRNRSAGLVPIGIYLTEGRHTVRDTKLPLPIYGGRDIVSVVRAIGANTIAVCSSGGSSTTDLRRLAWRLEGTGIDLIVAPALTDIAGPRVHIRPLEGLPLLHVEEPTLSGLAWLTKSIIDKVAALFGLILLTPLLIVIAILVKVSSPGPVFFRQTRIGREGKAFRVWKFRTMYTDAEQRLASLMHYNESDGLLFKMKNDPRVTPIGRWLRRTSLDELPQLINVLVGEMSLVGPRPLPAEDGDFMGDVRRRLLVRPGITGLWQVSGRSDLSWDDAVRLDLYYVDNWSLTFDLVILWRTIWAVLQSKGAY